MKPPMCELCGRRFDPSDGGGLVHFADEKSLPNGMTGHPHGVEWYCKRHYDAAEGLHHFTYADAMRALRRIYSPLGRAPQWLASIRLRLRPPKHS